MFGSTTPFGQSSSSPFGTQSVFGQTSTANNNPFAPKPFGSPTTPFAAQTGSSPFGTTSTAVFGQPSTPTFGASSPSPFGSSTPAFGASSSPAFGNTSSAFGSGSLFGQKPSFGSFGSSPSQSSPFGSTFQQTQPTFGSSAFGATSTPAFGATATPAFGATSTPAFGATTTPAFGSTSTSLFGAASTPTFGSTSFGASSTPGFGSSATTAFGATSTPGFGASSSPAFGTSTSAFNFGSTLSFGQTAATFGSTPFGTTPSPFGAQNSPFGSQTTASAFGQSSFGSPAGGTRIQPYTQMPDIDSATSGSQPAAKLDSISAMPAYKDKCHEELRWEDYQRGDKGGPNPSGTLAATPGFAASQPNAFASTGAFGQTTSNLFSSTSNNPFAAKPSPFASTGFGSTSTSIFNSPFGNTSATSSSPYASSTSSGALFGQTSGSAFAPSTSPSLFANTTPPFAAASMFGTSTTNTSSSFGTGLSLINTQSSGLFQTSPAFGQQSFGQASSGFPSSTPAFSTGSLFSTPTPGMTGGLFGSAPSPLFSTQPVPAQTQSTFSFLPQTQTASAGGFLGASNTMNQAFGQPTLGQSNMVMQPALVSNPFGTLPAMPQMSIGNVGSSPSVQFGISSLPVAEKPLPSRTLSMVVPRHLSQRRIKVLPRKYNLKSDGPKVPFFADDEESPTTPKADAFFIPRENPRNLIIHPIERWPPWGTVDKQSVVKDAADKYNAASAERERNNAAMSPTRPTQVENGTHQDDCLRKEHQATTQHGNSTSSIERLMPKLLHADYFTEPQLEELAAKERDEPGYCCRVRDFVVGRHGYGSIKFLGETDVRALDLQSTVEFNNREVIVYKDDNKKPPVGQGLNKPAEVTLLNIKCMNKKTGEQYAEGPRVDKYKEMLVKKAEEQGAEFISFNPVKGVWKFRVKHFSSYGFGEAGHLDFF